MEIAREKPVWSIGPQLQHRMGSTGLSAPQDRSGPAGENASNPWKQIYLLRLGRNVDQRPARHSSKVSRGTLQLLAVLTVLWSRTMNAIRVKDVERYDSYGHTAVQPYRPLCLGRSANLRLDTRTRKGLRTWYIFAIDLVPLRDQYTNNLSDGNRWHINCFRCNNCSAILDSDAKPLLLGDGSLICNNCISSCTGYHVKIEDLAIFTGGQGFCTISFKCRNCKTKIDNLKYARTSQGIFCMQCHESLTYRRRKKTTRKAMKLPPLLSDLRDQIIEADFPASDTLANSSIICPDRWSEVHTQRKAQDTQASIQNG